MGNTYTGDRDFVSFATECMNATVLFYLYAVAGLFRIYVHAYSTGSSRLTTGLRVKMLGLSIIP